MQRLEDELLAQQFISEQFSDVRPTPLVPVAVQDAGGAISGISSNTLVVGGKTGTVQNVELPQPLAPASSPTFSTLNCNILNTTDDTTSRNNLGLGGLAIRNPGAAVAESRADDKQPANPSRGPEHSEQNQ